MSRPALPLYLPINRFRPQFPGRFIPWLKPYEGLAVQSAAGWSVPRSGLWKELLEMYRERLDLFLSVGVG